MNDPFTVEEYYHQPKYKQINDPRIKGKCNLSGSCICEEKYQPLDFYDEAYVENMVIVNFHMSARYLFSHSYGITTSIAQIKYDISNKFHIPDEYLQIMHWHVFLYDCTTLEFIHTECPAFLDLTIVNLSSDIPAGLEDMVVPDIITVHIESEDIIKDITVEIENRCIRKPYIGGFRNKKTGIEYHHAYSQTGPPPPKITPRDKWTRDTQTIYLRNRKLEMKYTRATQMSNEHIWIPTVHDKILTSKKYETADEREKRLAVLDKIILIQRYFRRWKLDKAMKEIRAEYRRRLQNEEDEKNELLLEMTTQRKKEIINKVFPRTRADFSMLYAMVDRWKKAHIERISKMHTAAAKLAEFYLLLNKEIEMLSAIEKQRQKLKQEMKIVNEIRFFDYISDPVRWTGYKGLKIAMDTIETQKGRQFKDLYYTACNHKLSTEERLEFLQELTDKLKKHNCSVGNELVVLLEREMELLKHGMDNQKMDMLHKRIQALLLKHIKMPECNEGVTRRMLKLKEEGMEHDQFFCPRCQVLKGHKEFALNHRNAKIRICSTCTWYDRTAEPWIDIAPYRFILRDIRRNERKRSSPSSIAFIVQERDIHYLVERIWHAQSVISENAELENLRLIRWNVKEEWSPWNCILLTDIEAQSHLRVKNLEEVYDEEVRSLILSRHLLARCVFANVLLLERNIRASEEAEKARLLAEYDSQALSFKRYQDQCPGTVPEHVLGRYDNYPEPEEAEFT